MPYCPECGSETGAGENYCQSCGADVSSVGSAESQTNHQSHEQRDHGHGERGTKRTGARNERDDGLTSTLPGMESGKTAKNAGLAVVYGFLALTVIGALAGPQSGVAGDTVKVRIIADGEWQGAISTGEQTRSIDGVGTKEFTLEGDPSIVSANAQKMGTGGELTVQIIKGGEVVAEQSTTASYGVAQVSESV